VEEFLGRTVEYQNWGANAATFSFLVTVFFTCLQGWSLFAQNATIRRNRSGESLSTTFFIYTGCYFFMFLVYGITKNSIAFMFNGCLGIPYIPIVLALYRFKGFQGGDWVALVLSLLMIPVVVMLEGAWQDMFVLTGLFGIIIPLVGQVREMYRAKSSGSVEPKFVVTFMVANIFWFTYGLTTGQWIFVVFNLISFLVLATALILYRRYRKTALS